MKTKILFILFLFTLGYSQEPINSEMLVERDGVFFKKDTNKPYSGPVFSLHENGQKKDKSDIRVIMSMVMVVIVIIIQIH